METMKRVLCNVVEAPMVDRRLVFRVFGTQWFLACKIAQAHSLNHK